VRVLYSPVSRRFFATRAWKEVEKSNGSMVIEVTGEKFDVTNDIYALVVLHSLELTPATVPHSNHEVL
jgi:predicted metallopeptidase